MTDNLYLSNSGQSSGEKPNGKSILSCAHCLVFLIINLLSPRHAITFQWCYTALSISRMRLQGVIINTMSGLIHEWITCGMNGNNKKGNPKYSDNKDYCERINQSFFSGKPENFYKHCFHLCPPRLKTVWNCMTEVHGVHCMYFLKKLSTRPNSTQLVISKISIPSFSTKGLTSKASNYSNRSFAFGYVFVWFPGVGGPFSSCYFLFLS